tara:strand:- start:34496 stop:34693 length:198 start_codon:yes stop_codon:yes gene_type:complete
MLLNEYIADRNKNLAVNITMTISFSRFEGSCFRNAGVNVPPKAVKSVHERSNCIISILPTVMTVE